MQFNFKRKSVKLLLSALKEATEYCQADVENIYRTSGVGPGKKFLHPEEKAKADALLAQINGWDEIESIIHYRLIHEK